MRIVFFIVLVGAVLSGFSQDTLVQHTKLSIPNDQLYVDALDQLYIIKGDQLQRSDQSGLIKYTYSNKQLGYISSIDVTNTLRLLIYYKTFGKVIYLDNTLSPIGETIDLHQLQQDEIDAVCTSYNNGLWTYAANTKRLTRYNQQLHEEHTIELQTVLADNSQIVEIKEVGSTLYLFDKHNGVYLFDKFGRFRTKIPIKNSLQMEVTDKHLVWLENDKLVFYDLILFKEKVFSLTISSYISFCLSRNKVLLTNGESIFLYNLN